MLILIRMVGLFRLAVYDIWNSKISNLVFSLVVITAFFCIYQLDFNNPHTLFGLFLCILLARYLDCNQVAVHI